MISKITLRNVRKFANLTLDINSKNVIITGLNASGKTTILEAISLLSITKSHRTKNLLEIIKDEKEFAEVKVTNDNQFKMVISPQGKLVSFNNKEIKKLSEYIGLMPSVFFSPNDLNLVYGSPSIRRQFLNQEISQLNPHYLSNLNLYNHYLKERNNLLKTLEITDENSPILKVLTSELIAAAKKIITSRINFINKLNEILLEVFPKLSGNQEKLNLVYDPSCKLSNIEEIFNKSLKNDLFNKATTHGPQRDDLLFYLDDKEALKHASQGQIRTIVLAIKISLCIYLKEVTKKEPILLLDDVLNELDITRQNRLLNLISKLGQIFITTVDTSVVFKDNLEKYQIIKL